MYTVKIRGKYYKRIPCGDNDFLDYNMDGRPCKDCGVSVGQYHVAGCEAEKCPVEDCIMRKKKFPCNTQLCGCRLKPVFD